MSKKLVPAFPVERSQDTPTSSHLRVRKRVVTPAMPSTSGPRPKKPRRLKLDDEAISQLLIDSGSEEEVDEDGDAYNFQVERAYTRLLRQELMQEDADPFPSASEEGANNTADGAMPQVEDLEVMEVLPENLAASEEGGAVPQVEDLEAVEVLPDNPASEEGAAVPEVEDLEAMEVLPNPSDAEGGAAIVPEEDDHRDLDVFSWSEDFSSFSGQEETYLRSPGPTVDARDPADIFMSVWDEGIMDYIVAETNRYAWQHIGPLTETESGLPEYLVEWTDTSVPEMYRYFALLILMSFCNRSRLKDYWTTGVLEMPEFRKFMPRNRFLLISKFLHFQDNDTVEFNLSSYQKKINKITPILEHCNQKFSTMYVPDRHLSLDESLLLWKGRLGWVQCIRTKAARFGIKSYELCEAVSGYQLRCLIYAGKDSTMSADTISGFSSCTAKVVLELMDGYLDVGHNLVMDNWYNQLSLTRFLKRRKTDVIGTLNRRRVHVPDDIKNINEKRMVRGAQIARHCGDITLIAWKDVKMVTAISTYHADQQLPARRAGQNIQKPQAIVDYNKYMGGVDSKDQKLSMYLMERKRGQKWYMKVFKRLLNTSLLNTFIIYTKNCNPIPRPLTHREFRYRVATDLLDRFPMPHAPAPAAFSESVLNKGGRRLMKANHFVEQTEKVPGKNAHKQFRCVRCTAAGRRRMVTLLCSFCKVPLCAGPCWAEYHTQTVL